MKMTIMVCLLLQIHQEQRPVHLRIQVDNILGNTLKNFKWCQWALGSSDNQF